MREATAAQVIAQIEDICARRHVNCSVEVKHEAPAAACHPEIIAGLINACRESEEVCQRMLCMCIFEYQLSAPKGFSR